MQLKRLEAFGFKSFADKVTLEFDKGITAIVGPNGSGKSNITDAIRWVLGEQNARNLRTKSAEDVIFTGSAARKPQSMAEVSLVFDNDDGRLAIDFSEVVVTRRMFRSNEGEFFINMSRCRLKDIYDLFADTGIGHSGMSIIGQNRIDSILNSKPEERRAFFEETAGIIKYKNRKKEAQRKLADTDANIVRVNDIVQEIELRLVPLSESAQKTLKYNELMKEYRLCRITTLSMKHSLLTKEADENNRLLTAAQDKALVIETETLTAQTKHDELMKEVVDLEKVCQEKAVVIENLRRAMDEAEKEIAVIDERGKQSDTNQRNILERRKTLNERLAIEVAAIGKLAGEKAALDREYKTASAALNAEKEKAAELTATGDAKRNEQRSLIDEQGELQQKLVTAERELALIGHELASDAAGKDERDSEREQIKNELDKIDAERRGYDDELTKLGDEHSTLVSDRDRHKKNLQELRLLLDEYSKAENRERQSVVDSRSKMQFLVKMQESYEGFAKAAKTVLTAKEPWREGIIGAVAEILDVPSQYVTAIDTALGGNAQNIVAKSANVAKAAIAFLKREHAGRATFLPLDTLTVRQNRENVNGERGVIGWANDVVTTKDEYRVAIDFLLSRTLIVDDLDNALSLGKNHGYRLRIVTLGGDLLNPGGSMTGGSTRSRETGYLGREGEIESLKAKAENAAVAEEQYRQKRRQTADKLNVAEEDLTKVLTKLQENMLKQTEFRTLAERTAAAYSAQEKALQKIDERKIKHDQYIEELRRSEQSHNEQCVEIKDKSAKISERLTELVGEIAALDEELNAVNDSIRVNEMETIRLEEKITGSEENLRIHRETKTVEEQNLRQNEQEEKTLADNLELDKMRREELQSNYTAWQKERAQQSAERENLYAERTEKMEIAQSQDNLAKAASRKLNDARNEVNKLNLAAAKLSFGINECEETMLSDYGLTPDRAAEEALAASPEEIEQKSGELKTALDELGPVNPNAPAEFDELNERHALITRQAADLTEAKEDLLVLIDEINSTMSKQFVEAFQKVQE